MKIRDLDEWRSGFEGRLAVSDIDRLFKALYAMEGACQAVLDCDVDGTCSECLDLAYDALEEFNSEDDGAMESFNIFRKGGKS